MNLTPADLRALAARGIQIPASSSAARSFRTIRSAISNMRCGDSVTPRPRIDPESPSRFFTVAVSTPNPLNGTGRYNWRKAAGHRKEQRTRTRSAMLASPGTLPLLPVIVYFTRFGRGTLDDDAVPGALKSVRDEIADAYGIADNDRRIKFSYAQVRRRKEASCVNVLICHVLESVQAAIVDIARRERSKP